MPRPKKCRRVCALPGDAGFSPLEGKDTEPVVLAVEEYEVIRLIDHLGCTQEEAAARMEVARTTVQAIYDDARRKLAAALVGRRGVRVDGGQYRLCPQAGECRRRGCGCAFLPGSPNRNEQEQTRENRKVVGSMKIAVTYENGMVFPHFGHTAQFKIYELENGKLSDGVVVPTGGSGHGALAGFLAAQGVDALICGGIGGGARTALAQAGIALYPGVSGSADAAAQALAEGRLVYNPDASCADHDHHHGAGCGHHEGGCGGHSCGEDHQGCAGR